MIRTFTIAAAALALAAPVIAADAAPKADTGSSAVKAHLDATSASMQARQHLVRQGYINISTLELDQLGRWSGTATKDGKTTIVAIKLPHVQQPADGK